eukprot:GHVS01032225.1.p1 GENE.GHVS01032225.1~~GHVS01032225.1.p1  ORF type:complete len:196 (+),score=29.01 GHVS01032225.1:168-755(+)
MYPLSGCRGSKLFQGLVACLAAVVLLRAAEDVTAAASPVPAGSSDVCDAPNYSFDGGVDHCACYELPGQTFCACSCSRCQGLELTGCNNCDLGKGSCTECNCPLEGAKPAPSDKISSSEGSEVRVEELQCHENAFVQTDLSKCRCNNRGGMVICACSCPTCEWLGVQACMQCKNNQCSACRCTSAGLSRQEQEQE